MCLAAKGDVSLEMERVLTALGGSGLKAERVLQVNFDHPVIARLGDLEGTEFDDTVTVLYNEALLAEGYKTEPEFLAALNRVLCGAQSVTATKQAKPAAKSSAKSTTGKSATKTQTAKSSQKAASKTTKSQAAKKTVKDEQA